MKTDKRVGRAAETIHVFRRVTNNHIYTGSYLRCIRDASTNRKDVHVDVGILTRMAGDIDPVIVAPQTSLPEECIKSSN